MQIQRAMDNNIMLMTKNETLSMMAGFNKCCNAHPKRGCLMAIAGDSNSSFLNLDEAVASVMDCRKQMSKKTPDEKKAFIQQLHRDSIENEKTDKLIMCYKIHGQSVCKKAISKAYGFSVKSLERASRLYKNSSSGMPNTTSMRVWKDDTIQPLTYCETKEIFERNVQHVGEYFTLLILSKFHHSLLIEIVFISDLTMIRAALTPLSSTQGQCSIWLHRYFHTYGDVDPAGDEM